MAVSLNLASRPCVTKSLVVLATCQTRCGEFRRVVIKTISDPLFFDDILTWYQPRVQACLEGVAVK